ncbi:MAG TPA: hypothetical protein VFY78_00080 [Gammaproteobacteria bacterium]|nr:hypothetical protein [Gammaproteobacteria bacterium]
MPINTHPIPDGRRYQSAEAPLTINNYAPYQSVLAHRTLSTGYI